MPKADYFKLFSSEDGIKVALFTSDCGWIENVSAQAVFRGELPAGLPHEELLLIKNFPIEHFDPEFINSRTELSAQQPPTSTVAIGSIIDSAANEMNIPHSQMVDFTKRLFLKMRNQLSAGHSLDSSFVSVSAKESEPLGWVFLFK